MKKPHDGWFYLAGEDLAFARDGLEGGFYAHVCVLSQQAVEKAMKGYLVSKKKDYPRTHGLMMLKELMNAPWLDEHIVHLKKLSEFYVPLRYPDAMPGSLPDGLPGKDDASDALNWAEEIVGLIRKHVK